jgi:hypothetical protein
MPYEISITKSVVVANEDIYINDCCRGGDAVRDRLMPLVRGNFEDIRTAREDWGWFIWSRKGPLRLAIDMFTDDVKLGKFRIWLSSSRRKFLLFTSAEDMPELETLKTAVMSNLAEWDASPSVERVQP